MTPTTSPPERTESHAREGALDWLMGRINYERTAAIPYNQRQLKLDRMRQLLTRLGQPDAGMKIVHVAGTKGKGSTSAMIAGILTAAGYRTGLFSSPHLKRIEERFAVDGQPCTVAEFVRLVDRLRPIVAAMDHEAAADGDPTDGPTYFEVITAMALLHFVERQVDAAVLEVGLGGRLDSTNVCLPAVSVITSISFDHTRQLGNTLAAIALEKAGIIKPGVPVVSGVTDPEPLAVIEEVAREHGCRMIQLGRDFHFRYQRAKQGQGEGETRRQEESTGKQFHSLSPCLHVSLSEPAGTISFDYRVSGQEHSLQNVQIGMRGPHQATNAAVALATVAELRHQGWCISTEAMRRGLSRTVLPGRVELFAGEPMAVLDTAHNPASARALVDALAELPGAARRTLILSVSSDKDVRGIVRELVSYFDRFLVTQYQENPRALSAEQLAMIIREEIRLTNRRDANKLIVGVRPSPTEAWQAALDDAVPGELVCIAGSFYLAAEMRALVQERAIAK